MAHALRPRDGWSCRTVFPTAQKLLSYHNEHKECDCEHYQIQNNSIDLIK